MKRVAELSDDEGPEASQGGCSSNDDDPAGGCDERCKADADTVKASFLRMLVGKCRCSKKVRGGTREGQVLGGCAAAFLSGGRLEELVEHRLAWKKLHKLDQDRLLFNVLLGCCSNVVEGARMTYTFLGQHVCKAMFCSLWGVGFSRMQSMLRAVRSGASGPPTDLRYLKKPMERPSIKTSYINTFLEQLYWSEAEMLPESLTDVGVDWWPGEIDPAYQPGLALVGQDELQRMGPHAVDVRWLPPGHTFEYWRSYNLLHPEQKCSFRLFWKVWTDSWGHRLKFRALQQHALCPVCVSHKLLIKQLSGNIVQRNRQIGLFEQHKKDQLQDRRCYWAVRAEAMINPYYICIIVDGMDQSKFCCPRGEIMSSKDLEALQRPRLHITAALCHNRQVLVSVSPADWPKNTNVTVELIAATLNKLSQHGLCLKKAHLHLQLDNTSSSNKNNPLLRFCSSLTSNGVVKSVDVAFLRKGHTHEDTHVVVSWFLVSVVA